MKKRFLLLNVLFASGLLLSLSGCFSGKQNANSSSKQSQTSESSEQVSSSASGETSSSEKSHEIGDEDWVDYANSGAVKLGLDYKGKDFYVDGVAQFTLKTAIDGDTAHFTPLVDSLGKGTMKARFYGIDTPESTGKVQPYGKPASNFTKEKLLEANENGTIVVSSAQDDYGTPNPDSTGSRYVSLVWVNLTKKNAPFNELSLLNLWIVQEGLSWVKNVQSMPQYADTFYAAENQAKEYKLNLFSGQPDPLFNYGEYEDASLLEIKQEIALTLASSTHENAFNNKKIRFRGTVAGFSNHILYLQDYVYYDNDNPSLGGEYCGINIFVGMGSISSKYTKLNTYIQVCGLAQDTENYGFQVTDTEGRFPRASSTSENDAQIIYEPAQNEETEHNLNILQYSVAELNAVASANPYNLECLNCNVNITETLTVNRVFINDSSSQEITLYFEGCSFNCYVPFNYKGNPDDPTDRWVTEDRFLNKQFTLTGIYALHKTQSGKITFQVIPNGSTGLVFVG